MSLYARSISQLTGGGGGGTTLTIGAFGSAPNTAGLTLSVLGVLNMEPADATRPGGVSTTTQSFLGQKTFLTGLTGTLTGNASGLTGGLGGQVHYQSAVNTTAFLANGTAGQVLTSAGTTLAPTWTTPTTGTVSAMAAFGSAPNANGGTISGSNLTLQPASASFPGGISTAAQTLPGAKTFTDPIVIESDVTYAHTRYEPVGALTPSNPAWEVGYRVGQNYFSIVEDDGSVKTTILDVALNGIVGMGSGIILNAPAIRTDGIATQAGDTILDLTVAGQALHVTSGSDQIQLTVKGYGTQTSDIFKILDISDAPLFGVANSGNVAAAGTITGTQLISTIATGTPPLVVASTTQVANLNAATAGSSTTSTTATNLAGGSGGTIPYQSAAATTAMLANGTAGDVLSSQGTTVAPQWITPASANTASALVKRDGSGNFAAGTITAALTGTASGNTTYSANNHGVVLSSATNAMVVKAPDASTTKVLTSGGASADPTWSDVSASSFGTQTAGTFLAGPTSGSAATPTFRALQTPTVQRFTSGSGTYTTATGALYIRVKMVGGGGAGGGSGSSGAGSGGTGGNSTWDSTLLVAGGGAGGVPGAGGGAGGTTSNTSGPVLITSISGGSGTGIGTVTAAFSVQGGTGGNGFYGGGGGGAQSSGIAGYAGATNTGGGGGGAAGITANGIYGAGGGGAGAFIEAFIASPAGSYSYAVGAAGTAGTAGTNGVAGGAGGSGYIVVEEYYQ